MNRIILSDLFNTFDKIPCYIYKFKEIALKS